MQHFGMTNKEHYGMLQYFLEWSIVQSFDSNYALYKTETSQRRTTDTFETINGQLRNALGSEKYRKTEM